MKKFTSYHVAWTNRERWFFGGFVAVALLWAFCLIKWNAAVEARDGFGGRTVTITIQPKEVE